MIPDRKPKPTVDAVNDAIGALSDLLHSLRAHAKAAAKDVKRTAVDVKGDAKKAGRSAMGTGRRTVRRAKAGGEGILDKAAKVWHEITGPGESETTGGGTSVVTRKRRASRRARV